MVVEIKEMIEFAGFNTKDNHLYLINRNAPSPAEKEVIEDIPFMQGVLDFSMVLGERVFQNREIEYEFLLLDSNYRDRAVFETILKQKLMPFGQQKLYDSHDNGYFWLGKCKSVEVEHDHQFNLLRATIVFDCYPFMFTLSSYFDDVWDSFDFNDGIAGFTKYKVVSNKDIILINTGTTSIEPEIETSSDIKVTLDNQVFVIKKGMSSNLSLSLKPGINKIKIDGNATVSFRWSAEVMG